MTKVRRNDPCPCGSGQKFKKCCGKGPQPFTARRAEGSGIPRLKGAERDGMRAAGAFNARLLDLVRERIGPGVRLAEIDDFVRTYTLDHGHTPATLGYPGSHVPFPKCCCTSVNEVICHGIPGPYVLKEGDIVNVDLTTIVDGWHGDQSETFLIGAVSPAARGVTQCAFDALYAAIAAIGPGSRIADIGHAIVKLAHGRGYSVVEDFQGHGVGRTFHTEPGIPHYPEARWGSVRLEPGMCFTIEPMINVGRKDVLHDTDDGWTARSADGSLSAQFEHTLLMTEGGVEILTQTERGPRPGHVF